MAVSSHVVALPRAPQHAPHFATAPQHAPRSEPYAILPGGPIGSGRFGRCYKAVDTRDGRLVCIKRTTGPPIDEEVLILRELQCCPEVVRLLDVLPGRGEIVMEMCEGGDLAHHLDSLGGAPLSERAAGGVAAQLLRALAACHAARVCYGDLKPTNVLLRSPAAEAAAAGKSPSVCLADFGCAQRVGTCGRAARSTGNRLYAAPEAFYHMHGLPSDVWSAGVLVYHLLAGGASYPFFSINDSLSECAAFQRVLSAPIDFARAPAWGRASPGARQLIERMLDRNPQRRITAAEALAHPWLLQQQQGSGVLLPA